MKKKTYPHTEQITLENATIKKNNAEEKTIKNSKSHNIRTKVLIQLKRNTKCFLFCQNNLLKAVYG